MQFGTPSPHGIETSLRRMTVSLSPADTHGAVEADDDATLGLLQTCVEAMSLLQAKFVGLEIETQIKLDAAGREIVEMRGALAAAQQTVAHTAQRLVDSEDRMARLEISALEAARQHGDDIAAARAEAATARMRGETDAMAFEHLLTRLTRIEEGLGVRLERAARDVADREAENNALRTHAEGAQMKSDRLQSKLRDVEATIADQRSRISCLQSKLATATYAMRMEHMARQSDAASMVPNDHDILDLQGLGQNVGKGMISAA